jgi:prepilin-type N-terminal cleavage/methylation domain-containing protein
MNQQRIARERGYTLSEVMIVIVIIGIMLAIMIPAVKRSMDRSRREHAAQTSDGTEAVRTAERAGFSQIEVVEGGSAGNRVAWSQICRAIGDTAFELDATDKQERRVRLTVCCHAKAGTVKCAIPLPMHPFPYDR